MGTIYGRPVMRSEYSDAYREAELRYLFSEGRWASDDETARMLHLVEKETRNRMLLIEKVRQYGIKVNDEAVAAWIREAFKDRDQKAFQLESYNRFVKDQLPAHGLTAEDFQRFVRNEVAIGHLVSLAGMPGRLVTPQEAQSEFRREHEQLETEVVTFASSNYLANVKIDPAAIATFYTNQQATYRIPERVQVNYVEFPVSNYLARADARVAQETNLSLKIDQFYNQRGANSFTDTNGQVMTATAAKDKIKSQMRDQFALVEARKDAIGFATELAELQNRTPADLEKLASGKKLSVKVSAPFSEFESPQGLNVPENFPRIAFSLTPQEPFAEQPVVGEDGVYVIGFNKKIPSELPGLDSIRSRVTEDYRRNQAQMMARAAGIEFQSTATNAIASGKTFEQAATAAKAVLTKLPPFSATTRSLPEFESKGDFSSLKNAAQSISQGQVSSFINSRDGGFVVYLRSRQPVSDAAMQSEFNAYLASLRRSKQSEAFSDWFRHEMDLARIQLPGDDKLAQSEQ
ncbi:MAG: hypothetical protein JWM99_4594 [Verrucomicrobiales bacterium]|nr:hypothetical protein [Verrucomicrobiales bacterium]